METTKSADRKYNKSYILVALSLIITVISLFSWYNQRLEVFGGGAVGGGGSSTVSVNYSGSANQYVLEDGKIVFFTLANEAEGGFYMDSSQTGQKTAFGDYYSAMTGTTNASTIGIMDTKLSAKQGKMLSPRYFTAGEAGSAQYTLSPGDANRIVPSTGQNGTYANGLYYNTLKTFVETNGGLETLVTQDATGVPTWKAQILQPLGDYKELSRLTLGYLVGDGLNMDERFNIFIAGAYKDRLDDLPSLTPEEQSELTLRYIDFLLCCYGVSEGTAAEGEWQAAIENYINGGGNGTIQQYSDNKCNVILTAGVAYNIGTGPQKGTHLINGWDALAVNMGITVNNDLSKHESAEAIASAVGRDLYNQIGHALNVSKVENPNVERTWYRGNSAYFNSALTNLLLHSRPTTDGGWQASGTGRSFMDEMWVMYSLDGTRHYGLNVVAPNPTKGTVSVKSDLVATANWGGPNDSSSTGSSGANIGNGKKKTSFIFGNLWEETDKNKMFNEGTSGEKSSLQNYRGSVANAVNAQKLLETVQENASLSLSASTDSKNDWSQIFNANSKYKVSFTINRVNAAYDISTENETAKNGYSFVNPDFYIAGKAYKNGDKIDISEIGWNKNDLQSFIFGTKPLDLILDKSSYNQLVENNTRVEMKFNVAMTIMYGNSEDKMSTGSVMRGMTNAIEATRVDYPMNTTGQFKYVEFHSDPLGYSELKEGTIQMDGDGSNETWEAMAGVPSTETLYFASGGSEFIVEVHMQYIPKERAKRTYRSAYQGIECEYKVADQANRGGTFPVPNTSGKESHSHTQTVNIHGGQVTITGTWTGKIYNKAEAVTAEGVHSCTATCTAVVDRANYDSDIASANAWVSALNATTYTWTSGSDQVTRSWTINNAKVTVNSFSLPQTTTASGSASHGKDEECSCSCTATANPDPDKPYSIKVEASLPAHVICGPCCQHDLPAVEDNWDQEFTYSYMRINSVKTWKIDRSYVDGMDEITYHETDVIKNDIVQGDPNVFYNIADLNETYYAQSKEQLEYFAENGDLPEKAFVTVGSQAGRLRYSLQAQQHDAVTWLENNGGKRTNKCNGDAHCGTVCPQNPSPVPYNQGHNNKWSLGVLYNNPSPNETQVNDEMWWSTQYAGAKKANGDITQQWDDVDKATVEWQKFKERRDTPNTVGVLSDMLILQTSTGDQSVLYYSRMQTRNSDKHFDYNADDYGKSTFNTGGVSYTDKTFSKSEQLYSTFDEIYTNNNLTASDWDETEEINVGGYNGNFKTPKKKFSGTNKKTIKTLFDKDGQGDGSVSDSLGHSLTRKVTDGSASVPGVGNYDTPNNNVAKHDDILNNNSYLAAPVKNEYRQDKVARLRLITDEDHPWDYGEHTIRQNPINSNKEYVTGDAYVFYKQILNYKRKTTEENRIFIYNFENETNDVLQDKGITIDAPYSDNHDKINNIVVHDPVSVDRAMLISLPRERDQRVDGSSASSTESTLAKLEASQVCPGTAALCEYRVLNCKYFEDTLVGNFDFNEGKVINKVTDIEYKTPTGFSVQGGELDAHGTRLQIPLSDLGLAFSKSLRLKVEADVRVDSGVSNVMLFSFNKYDLYLTDGGICFNTGNSFEYGNRTNIADGQKHHIEAIFDFGVVNGTTNNSGCSLKIDGRIINLTKNNESKKLEAGMIGSTFNIGSWGYDSNYPAKFKLDNLKITKLGGSSTHVDSCYETVNVHAKTKVYKCDHSATFDFKNKVQTYVVPETGYYKIESWGAQGGDGTGTDSTNVPSRGGLGGYSSGNVYLVKGQILNIYTGGRGGYSTENGIGGQPSYTKDFNYTGGVQTYTIPESGTYNLEVWGAQGGNAAGGADSLGGKGGYSSGKKYFNAGDVVYVYVGGQGTYSSALGTGGGYNGGGHGGPGGYGGGGMTHISTVGTDNLINGIKDNSYMVNDPYGGSLIMSDDDSGSPRLSAYMTAYLTAGTKYTFFTSRYSTSQSGNTAWSINGPGLNLSGTDYIDEGSWADKTYDKDCLHVFTAPQTGTYSFSARVGTLKDPTIFLYTYAEKKVEAYAPTTGGSFNSGAVIIAAGGGGGGDNTGFAGTVAGGADDGAGGVGGGLSGGDPKINGALQGGFAATQSSGFARGYGQSAYVKTDTGGAGAGWFGGKVTNNNNGGAAGGSGYIGGVTNGNTTAGQRSGNGFARIKKEYSSGGYNGGGKAGSGGYGGGGGTDVRTTRMYTLDDLMKDNGTMTYGPYISLDAGTYQVTIYGNGLNKNTVKPSVYTNNGVSYSISNLKKTNSKITYTVNVTKDVKAGVDGSGLEFRLHHTNNSDYAFSRVEIKSTYGDTSLQSRIIVSGGGGGADDAGGTLFGNNDGSGGAGGGLQGGSAFVDGKQVFPYTAKGGGATQTSGYDKWKGEDGTTSDTGGGGGGYYGATSSQNGNGGGGGGSAFTSGLSNSLTVAGVQHGNGKVKITPLDVKHNQNCPFEMSEFNKHVHNANCIEKSNEILIGAFLMEYNGDAQPLKTLIGQQAFDALNNYKSDVAQVYDFTATNNAQFKSTRCELQNNSDGLILKNIQSDSYIYNSNLNLPAAAVNYIDVRLKIVGNSTNHIQAYWKTGYDNSYNEAKSMTASVTNNGTWQTVRIPVKDKATWKDTITGLRLDLAGNNAAGGTIYVDRIELRGNGISKTTTQSTGLMYTYKGFKDDLSSNESGNGKISYGITDGPSAASTTFSGGYVINSGNLNGWDFSLPVNINNASALEVIGVDIVNSTSSTSLGIAAYNSSGALVGTSYATMEPNKTQTLYVNTANWTGSNIARLDFDTASSNVTGTTKISQIRLYGYGTVSGGQQSGGRYEYTTGSDGTKDFNYTGGIQNFTVPQTGKYTLEVWGAAGGTYTGASYSAGNGGYVKATVELTENHILGVRVGGAGRSGSGGMAGGYPDGGYGSTHGGGGGGGTAMLLNGNVLINGGGGSGSGHRAPGAHGGSSNGNGYGGAGGRCETYYAVAGSNYVYSPAVLVSQSAGARGGNGFARISWTLYTKHVGDNHTYTKVTVNYNTPAIGSCVFQSGMTTGDIANIQSKIDILRNQYLKLVPDTVNGLPNPVFSCGWKFNTHDCALTAGGCKIEKILTCSEPHHMNPATHYPGNNPICWDACHNDENHKQNKDEIEIDGVLTRLGTFINTDYGFEIYFPNIGDFAQQTNLWGISSPTDIRGMSYVDDMDITKWTREKRIKFDFDTLFYNPSTGIWEQYLAGSWISLPILKPGFKYDEFTPQQDFADNAYTHYKFYCTLNNQELASAKIQYESEAINAAASPGGKEKPYLREIIDRTEKRNIDNTTYTTNRLRSTTFKSKHSAFKTSYVDVVGRIGNLFITDTEDMRFCNFFKMPTDEGWVIEGIVHTVNQAVQNNFLSWHNQAGEAYKDIRGIKVKKDTGMYNTWFTQSWNEDRDYNKAHGKLNGSTSVDLPLTSKKNNVSQLLSDPLKPGYNIFFELSTIGMYSKNMQVLPHFYALNLCADENGKYKLTPLDVYMTVDNEYVPINYYDAFANGVVKPELKEKLFEHVLNLEWSNESIRRNYTSVEKYMTNELSKIFSEGKKDSEAVKELSSPDNMIGFKYALGTLQLMNAEGHARTFIGSTYTNNEEFNKNSVDTLNIGDLNLNGGKHMTNVDELIQPFQFWYRAQRWHLKVGLPSSAVFVKYNNDNVRNIPTDILKDKHGDIVYDTNGVPKMNYQEIQDGHYVILMTAELTSYGERWTLAYDQEGYNGKAELPTYKIGMNGKEVGNGNKVFEFGDNFNGQEIKGTILAIYDAGDNSTVDIDITGTH